MSEKIYIYSILSCLLSVFGFKVNNETAIIGAMILSPILQPTTYTLKNKNSSYNEIYNGILTTVYISIIIFCISSLFSILDNFIEVYNEETFSMKLRLEKKQIINEFFATFIVGIGIAYAIIEKNTLARAGLTLGITLIPMLSLSGLYFGNYLYDILFRKEYDLTKQNHIKSFKILTIYLMNIILTLIFFKLTIKYILKK
jgi:hypothetical protein